MNEEYWVQVEEAYSRVIDLPPDARTPFLCEVYQARPDIRREVESLLEHQEAAQQLTQHRLMMAAVEMFGDDGDGLIGRVIENKYQVREFLGAGGMAEVYLADHIALEMPFALKRPRPVLRGDPEFRKRFLEEARRAVILKHENVTRVHDVIEVDNDMFVVMEYVEGDTLAKRAEDLARPFTIDEFLPIALQCGLGLAAAHEKRIVHLDVKPANIMLTPSGQVKICDFGVARRLTSDDSSDSNATTMLSSSRWHLAGTPAYMAPEVILGTNFDERADLFSLGTVFYEMLTGKNPFRAETAMATTAQVVSLEAPPLSSTSRGIDPRLERIITRLMTKDPNQRYGKATDLVEDLRALRRSRNRFQDMARNVREAFAESWPMKVATAVVTLCLIATPPAWIYSDQVGRWLGIPQFMSRNTVVVLGLRVEGDGISQPYADGLADVLTGRLRTLPAIDVVSTQEVSESGIKKPSEALRRLGANLVITGTFYRTGDMLRIVLTLIDGSNGKLLEQKQLTPRFDSLTVQSQVMEATLGLLELQLTPTELGQLNVEATPNASAHALYLEGKGLLTSRKAEDIEPAIQLFQTALSQDSNFSAAYAGLGLAYRAKYQTLSRDRQWANRALEACDQAVKHDPNLAAGHTCLGAAYSLGGDDEQAKKEYELARQLDPRDDEIYRGLARSHEALNNLEAAEAIYRTAINTNPDYWYNYVWLGQFFVLSRPQYSEAVKWYKEAIVRAPDNPVPYLGLSSAQILLGTYEDAVESCKKSISLRPSDRAYNNLGQAYFNLRRYDEAARAYEAARQLNPAHYRAAGQLARAYYWMGNRTRANELWAQAIELARQELSINPGSPSIHVMLARYHSMLNHRADAMSHLQIALQKKPKDAEYQSIAAVVHNQFGERLEAIRYLETAVDFGWSMSEIDAERELDNLREDPRFLALNPAAAVRR